MALFNNEVREQLRNLFNGLDKNVKVALFTQEDQCHTCEDTRSFMNEISELSPKIELLQYDLIQDHKRAAELQVELTPSIVLLDENGKDYGIKFNGIPAGHEINSFIAGLMEMSGIGQALPAEIESRLKDVQTPMHIRVFVTLGCPHCPGAVSTAHRLAMENENITAEMIESSTFPELANEFEVSSVPKIVFNDHHDFVGNQPLEAFIDMIEQVGSQA
jgi:glutaredoxin-like protein